MSEENENVQTAVDQDPKVTTTEVVTTESGTAQEDGLDAILKEFDERKASTDTGTAAAGLSSESKTTTGPLDVAALAALEQKIGDIQKREERRQIEGVFSSLTDGVQADAIDAESFLNAMALREPKLNDIYAQRETNPKLWNRTLGTLKQEFSKRYGQKVDKQVTESRDAVASAVRSASTAAPQTDVTESQIKSMNKSDFDDLQRKLGVSPV